jgi:hypothetical protein
MKKMLGFAAAGEAVAGLGLLIVPSLVTWLLFGQGLTGISISMARVTGIALLGLGISCWPNWTALYGMLTYSALVTLYLAYVGIRGESVGLLLWPAVVLHVVLTLLLARSCSRARQKQADVTTR